MLCFAEEIFLLALDDRAGTLKPLPVSALEFALPGALLAELAFLNRIDVDLQALRVVDNRPTGNALLDEVLGQLESQPGEQSTSFWLSFFAGQARQIQDCILAQLVAKGILKIEARKILWVFKTRRYPLLDNREIKEVKTRLRELILSDDIPDPRDAVLISLAEACRLFDDLFSEAELARAQPRLKALAKIELIGQEVAKSIREIAQAMALAMMP